MAVRSRIHAKHINSPCGQNADCPVVQKRMFSAAVAGSHSWQSPLSGCRLAAPTESACARSGVANASHHAPADRPRSLNARFGVLRAALCDMPLYPWVCRSDVSKERSDLMSVSPRGITHISLAFIAGYSILCEWLFC